MVAAATDAEIHATAGHILEDIGRLPPRERIGAALATTPSPSNSRSHMGSSRKDNRTARLQPFISPPRFLISVRQGHSVHLVDGAFEFREMGQLTLEGPKPLHLDVDLIHVLFEQNLRMSARTGAFVVNLEDLSDLRELESEALRTLDEAQSFGEFGMELPVARRERDGCGKSPSFS